jgi:dTDP-4-amino-4,6-dideoxygalactose transaminase
MRHVPIPMARPLIGDEEAEAARRVLGSGWVMQGPEVEAFERDFAAYVGAPFACAVSSGTAALHLALLAVGVRAGHEVITVSHSFIATANSVRHCGAMPIFVDVEASSFNIDPSQVEAAITGRTRAILCVHQMGLPCDVVRIVEIAARHGLAVVEDAACAAGSELARDGKWERIGKPHGDVACFSFHPRKLITTGDGGMITTANGELDARVRAWRSHGSRDGVYGFNYRMTDVQAAVGRVQLSRLSAIVDERRRLATHYRELLPAHVVPPAEPSWARSNWQSFCVRLPTGVDPEEIVAKLAAADISTRRGISNTHTLAEHADARARSAPLPESERAWAQCLSLPLYPGMTADDQSRVVAGLIALTA